VFEGNVVEQQGDQLSLLHHPPPTGLKPGADLDYTILEFRFDGKTEGV
jgi:hypothetical protein